MTAAPGRPWDRWALWAGHYEPAFMTAALTALAAETLTRHRYPALTILTDLALLAWGAAIFAHRHWHQPGLCPRCAAATPLDPQAAVTRWTPALRVAHSRWFDVAASAAILPCFLPGSVTSHILGIPPGVRGPYAALAFTLLTVFVLAGRKHRQLRPWCPYCHWGGGGEEETVPEPEPDPQDDGVSSSAG